MTIKTKPFNFTEGVETEEDVELYMSIFFEEDGIDGFNSALYHLAKRKDLSAIVERVEKSFRSKMGIDPQITQISADFYF